LEALIAQKKLLNDKISKTIVFTGSFGAGKSLALAFKALSAKSALVLDLDDSFIKYVHYQNFTDILEKEEIEYKITKPEQLLSTKNSEIYFRTTEDIKKLLGFKTDLLLIDNFELIEDDEYAEYLYEKIFYNKKQTVLFINNHFEIKNDFIRKLLRTEKIIHANLSDNPFLPKEFIKEFQ